MRADSTRSRSLFYVAILLASLSAPATCIGQHLSDFSTQRYGAFERIPAVWGRLWAGTVYAGMKENCPSIAVELPNAARTMEYGFSGGGSINSGGTAIARNVQLLAWLEAYDGKAEIVELVRRKGCTEADHKLWMQGAQRYLTEPELAGDIVARVDSVCERSRQDKTDCRCLSETVDSESVPEERRALLSSSDAAASFREIVKSRSLGEKIKTSCGSNIPNFGMTEVPIAQRQIATTEYVGRWKHAGAYLNLRCLFKPQGATRYRARCSKGIGDFFEGDAVLENAVLTVDWKIPAPRRLTLQSDGSLKSDPAGEEFELVIRNSP